MDTYEQKYKDALEVAKEQLEGAKVFDYKEEQIAHDIRTTTYAIFPELATNEQKATEFATTHDGKIIGFAHIAAL